MIHVLFVGFEIAVVLGVAALFWNMGNWLSDLLAKRHEQEEE